MCGKATSGTDDPTKLSMAGLLSIAWSFFIHSDFFEAFRAAPHGIWNYFHLPTPVEADKGYCQSVFERDVESVRKAVKNGVEKIASTPINPRQPHHVVDNLFYRINLTILQLKLAKLENLAALLDNSRLGDNSADSLAKFCFEESKKVRKNVFV